MHRKTLNNRPSQPGMSRASWVVIVIGLSAWMAFLIWVVNS